VGLMSKRKRTGDAMEEVYENFNAFEMGLQYPCVFHLMIRKSVGNSCVGKADVIQEYFPSDWHANRIG
jgi:hypothetical protein